MPRSASPWQLAAPPDGDERYYYRFCAIEIEGYGIEDLHASNMPSTPNRQATQTAFIGIGDTLATPLWTALTKDYEDRKVDLCGSPLTPKLLGSDWRGLTGFDGLWLTDTEYAALDAGQRAAVRDWINLGGTFYLCAQTLDPALRASLGLRPDETEARPGFGLVRVIPWDGKAVTTEDAVKVVDSVDAGRTSGSVIDATDWPMTRSVGSIPLNAFFLIGFIVVFAVLVGPLNLFVFAGASRRHRLFWTTPLISVGASLLLILVIILQDGFGGTGERAMVTLLLPGEKKAVVTQEQVARTGVLFSRGFGVSEDVYLTPVKSGYFAGRSFAQTGRNFSGDWFASRSVQAHRAREIVPSRAEIQLLNAEAVARDGASPVVVSTIPAALKEIRFVDAAKRTWIGGSLRTGERITLRADPNPAPPEESAGSSLLTNLIGQTRERPGYFYAVSDEGAFIETLPSIRWRNQRSVYVGQVTAVR